MPHPTMETINPALLMRQASHAPPSSNSPSNPAIASQFTGPVQQATPPTSPYPNSGGQGAWMGSVGFTTRFTRDSMGYGRATAETQTTAYEPEPLQPLFGRSVSLSPLPEPTSENTQIPPGNRMGGDLAWLYGRPQSGYIQGQNVITCNGEQRIVAEKMYICRVFRAAGTSR
ncbi:hypothetical protein FG05_02065 [Fusarium graminearum]|nr:hypothetical protein FG05_02065 [Fusarium graminearum]